VLLAAALDGGNARTVARDAALRIIDTMIISRDLAPAGDFGLA
jgi:hypothetical protein